MAFGPVAIFEELTLFDYLQVGLLFLVLYVFLRFLRRTIAGGIFRGPAMLIWVVILGSFLVMREARLEVLEELLRGAFPVFVIGLVVIFQTELRHGIARIGEMRLLNRFLGRGTRRAEEIRAVDEIVRAVTAFAKDKIGALIAVERNIDLGTWISTGVPMNAVIRAETLDTIFSTHTVLHDGAVVVRGSRIAAAGCLFPLTERPALARKYGTRHRAAIGLSEQTDAVVIVVSEERGQIHLAERGQLTQYTDADWLTAYLNVVFAEKQGLTPPEAD